MSTSQIDAGISRYYGHKRIQYRNDDGIGKFAEWCEHNGYDTDSIKQELALNDASQSCLIEFDDSFPTNKTGHDRIKQIFDIIKHCLYNVNAFTNSTEISQHITFKNEKNITEILLTLEYDKVNIVIAINNVNNDQNNKSKLLNQEDINNIISFLQKTDKKHRVNMVKITDDILDKSIYLSKKRFLLFISGYFKSNKNNKLPNDIKSLLYIFYALQYKIYKKFAIYRNDLYNQYRDDAKFEEVALKKGGNILNITIPNDCIMSSYNHQNYYNDDDEQFQDRNQCFVFNNFEDSKLNISGNINICFGDTVILNINGNLTLNRYCRSTTWKSRNYTFIHISIKCNCLNINDELICSDGDNFYDSVYGEYKKKHYGDINLHIKQNLTVNQNICGGNVKIVCIGTIIVNAAIIALTHDLDISCNELVIHNFYGLNLNESKRFKARKQLKLKYNSLRITGFDE